MQRPQPSCGLSSEENCVAGELFETADRERRSITAAVSESRPILPRTFYSATPHLL